MTENVPNVTVLPKKEKKFNFNPKLVVTVTVATVAAVIVAVVVYKLKEDGLSLEEAEIVDNFIEAVPTSN